MSVAGLLLAAGAGRRMGLPKALLRDQGGVPLVDRAVGVLLDAGCEMVTVVLGASADEVTALLTEAGWTDDPAVTLVLAEDWAEGMGASLRAGLRHLLATGHDAAVVSLVDLPDVPAEAVRRVLARVAPAALARATYDGRPGHPVLLGREHWQAAAEGATGDRGARDYLATRDVEDVECGDLATGRDVDRPDEL
jgi:CTP:molybdopterin cytidylyltransferase MocA